MEALLVCELCRHGASAHFGAGCDEPGCACTATRDDVIAVGINAARDEIRSSWERPAAS